jgi:Glycosyltransferase family 87
MTVTANLDSERTTRMLVAGFMAAITVWLLVICLSDPTINVTDPLGGKLVTAQDARSYYGFNFADLYAGRTNWNSIGAYPYSPAFAQLVYPLNLLPWPLFVAAWTAIMLAAVFLMTGRELFMVGLMLGSIEIAGGNISLLLAIAIVAGFRHPWTWAFVLLTKITPGIGLLWFALRREWRQLATALGATAAIIAVSYVMIPGAWQAWINLLVDNAGKGGTWAALPVPLLVRGPIGVALIVWGAPRNQRWVVPVGAMLALPALWYGSLSMLLAVIPLTTPDERRRAWDRIWRGRSQEPVAA